MILLMHISIYTISYIWIASACCRIAAVIECGEGMWLEHYRVSPKFIFSNLILRQGTKVAFTDVI